MLFTPPTLTRLMCGPADPYSKEGQSAILFLQAVLDRGPQNSFYFSKQNKLYRGVRDGHNRFAKHYISIDILAFYEKLGFKIWFKGDDNDWRLDLEKICRLYRRSGIALWREDFKHDEHIYHQNKYLVMTSNYEKN